MSRRVIFAVFVVWLSMLVGGPSVTADAQHRGHGVPPSPPGHAVVRGHVVFVGGYFYDPHFGPYPWWGRGLYPYAYFPLRGLPASVRVLATPKEAGVYVDGFYAGVVADFDGIFQSLPLPPGGHEITLFYEGYCTVRRRVYLSPGSVFKLRQTMERLPEGVASEPPPVAPPLPPPPAGSFLPVPTPPRAQPGPSAGATAAPPAVGYGSLSIRVQPGSAEVMVDSEPWASTVEGQFVLQLTVGSHRVDIVKAGFQHFSMEVQVRQGETTPLNIVLSRETR
jgi:hypothetical protein